MAIGRLSRPTTSTDTGDRPTALAHRHGRDAVADAIPAQRVPWLDRSHPLLVALCVAVSVLGDLAINITNNVITSAGTLEWSHQTPSQLARAVLLLVTALVIAAILARWRHTRAHALMATITVFMLISAIAAPSISNVGGFPMSTMLFCFLGTYYVTLQHGTPPAVIWFVGGLAGDAAVLVAQWLATTWRSFNYTNLLVLGVLKAIMALVAIALASRRRYLGTLLERNRMLALERDQRAQLAVADERARIAAEMHDVVSHSLAVMVTLADGAGRVLPADVPTAQEALAQIGDTGRAAVADMRRLLAFLRADAELSPQPGLAQLGELVEQMKDAGLPVTLTTDVGLPADPSLGLAVYRIVQEGLTNVLRHAPDAAWVQVSVTQPEPGRVEVCITNATSAGTAGVGTGAGQGLMGVRQRVAVWNGELDAGPTPAGGWALRAQLHTGTHEDDKE